MRQIYISKKRAILAALCTLGCMGVAVAQGPIDAVRNSRQQLNGSARAQAMGGAVSAVGADASAVFANPAGITFYQRPTLGITANIGSTSNIVTWSKEHTEQGTNNYRQGGFNQVSYVAPVFLLSSLEGARIVWGFTYNNEFDYKCNYDMIASGANTPDLATYIAAKANRYGNNGITQTVWDTPWENAVTTSPDPLVGLGYVGTFIEGLTDKDTETLFRSSFSEPIGGGERLVLSPVAGRLMVREDGGRHSFDFTVGGSISDYFHLGMSVRMGSHTYRRSSIHRQDYNYAPTDNRSWMELHNDLSISASSLGLNIGAIVSLGDYGRLAVAYLTPQVMRLEETYSMQAIAYNATFKKGQELVKTPENRKNFENEYTMVLPGKFTLGAMGFLGKYGLLSYDFELRNIGSGILRTADGNRMDATDFLKEDYGIEMVHRVGLELRPTSKLQTRIGFSTTINPLKPKELRTEPQEGIAYDVVPAGTMPDFTLPRTYSTYSLGFGYKISRHLALDLAYVHSVRTDMVYQFPGEKFETIEGTTKVNNLFHSYGAEMKDRRNNVVLSARFSF